VRESLGLVLPLNTVFINIGRRHLEMLEDGPLHGTHFSRCKDNIDFSL
jgi:hypothetical protein